MENEAPLPEEQSFPRQVVGITATVPSEIVYASGLKPVDLNNLFITSHNPKRLVEQAESAGFSPNICAWIKGIYSTVINLQIRRVIAVTGGDCSNTVALAELLGRKGVEVIHFEYPWNRDRDALLVQFEKLMDALGTNWSRVHTERRKIARIRSKLKTLDRLTYHENVVSGLENHLFLVSSSDFKGNPAAYEAELDRFLLAVRERGSLQSDIRIGYLGVPPVFSGFYEHIEGLGARVVFNEVQRQFSMPHESQDIVDQYLQYTYPYDMGHRLRDIRAAITQRHLDGLIHYTQTFCYRQLYDIMIRESFHIPILTLEGDCPGPIDGRTGLRIETFVEMLKARTRV